MRRLLATHLSIALTTLVAVLVTVLLVTVAIVSNGYPAQRMHLNDGAVWVTSGAKQLLGRANTQIQQLNSVVPAASPSTDVVQSGSTVLLLDHGSNTVGVVNRATAKLGKTVPLPARDPSVALAGSRVAISSAATGALWLLPLASLRTFDATSTPTVTFGGHAVSVVDPSGRVFAYSPAAHRVYRVDAARSDTVAATDRLALTGPSAEDAVTAVSGTWAVLHPSRSELALPSGTLQLPSWFRGANVLQQPSSNGRTLYVASNDGLVSVPAAGGRFTTLLRGDFGSAAAPVVVNGCVFAAWSDGTVFRRCSGDADGTPQRVDGISSASQLAFRVNGDDVVLNDTRTGRSWAVQHGNALIDNWADFAKIDKTHQQIEQSTEDTPPTYEKAEQPPVAVDDSFGVRPGRPNPLPVLLNDYDANGDVLAITSIDAPAATDGRVDLVGNNQQLQITLAASATGSFSFGYSISDGRGGSANARVTVEVRAPGENSPPIQVRTTKAVVVAAGRVTSQVLGDWYDPDGDPLYLQSASVSPEGTVGYTPQGSVVYSDHSSHSTLVDVALAVSDGSETGSGRLAVTVRAPGDVPIIADPFVVVVASGTETSLSPLAHARGGTGTLRLAAVPSKPDATITPDYDAGTFRFSSSTVGTHLLDYAVTDGTTSTNGQVRVEVVQPPSSTTTPITVPHTAFVQEQASANVDVLATDIDPTGGVLLITSVSIPSSVTGVRVEVLQHRLIRVTLTKPLSAQTAFTYHVSNGLADAQGSVSVVQIPHPSVRQPPIANPDTVSVRVGDVIDIPVLANDVQPDGDDLTLDPTLPTPLPPSAGLLFTSGTMLRYLAPDTPGNYTAVYRVDAADGQWASTQVSIAVRELDTATNAAPVPRAVTARVLAGQTVRIPIPLDGIDPDGDSVKLVGQDSAPDKGAVTAVGANWMDYRAGDYSTGLDSFGYSVVDALGARASGTVRIGIAEAPTAARNPVATSDEVTVRPGRIIAVQVLTNDSDPAGSRLTVTGVTPTTADAGTAKFSGSLVRVKAPRQTGRYGFVYSIRNATGGTASAFLTVIVRTDAPLARPLVQDSVLTLSDILGRKAVTVDVRSGVFFADGSVSGLKLAVLPGYAQAAHVTTQHRIRVQVRAKSQIIPFSLTRPDDAHIVSYGFIWVPGTDDALPQLARGAQKLSVQSESTLTIHLNEYVVAVGGRPVRLTDASTVHATHSNGDDPVRNDDTLVFTSAANYFGPASIAFQVTDGSSPSDPKGHVATLVLPITVTPRQNQPPTFTGGEIDLEPGQQRVLDLTKLTRYPYAKDIGDLGYRILGSVPSGFSANVNGSQLALRTSSSTDPGATGTLQIGVRSAAGDGQAGRLLLTVVPSTRPLASPADDQVVVRRGQTSTVDVLANDEATNPFPDTPLTVVAVRGTSTGSLPAGITVTRSADRSRLTVSASADAPAVDSTIQYEVADATGNSSRYAWGLVTVSVQDRPDPISGLSVSALGDRTITLSWAPGPANNAPILDYRVTLTDAGTGNVVGVTTCTSTTCSVNTPGNGRGNQVLVSVAARNAIGTSDSTSLTTPVWSDALPAAPMNPTATALDHGLRISWSKPPDAVGASAITSYQVSAGGISRTVPVSTEDSPGTRYSVSITDDSIGNGTPLSYTVASRNDVFGGNALWNVTNGSATPAGPPVAIGTVSADPDAVAGTSASIDWGSAFDPNGAPITAYYVASFTGDTPSCSVTGVADGAPQLHVDPALRQVVGTALGTVLDMLLPNRTYSFIVYAYNGQGCTPAQVVSGTTHRPPGTPTAVAASLDPSSSNTWDFTLHSVAYSSPGSATSVSWNYRMTGDFPTEQSTLNGAGRLGTSDGHYGHAASVSVQVCESYADAAAQCSGWSGAFGLGVPVSAAVGGLHYDNATHVFSFTSWPAGSYDSVRFSCTGDGQSSPPPAVGTLASCTASGSPADALTVSVVSAGSTYTASYQASDYQ